MALSGDNDDSVGCVSNTNQIVIPRQTCLLTAISLYMSRCHRLFMHKLIPHCCIIVIVVSFDANGVYCLIFTQVFTQLFISIVSTNLNVVYRSKYRNKRLNEISAKMCTKWIRGENEPKFFSFYFFPSFFLTYGLICYMSLIQLLFDKSFYERVLFLY